MILDIPSKYFLQISFAFAVIQEKGTAKFDSKTHKLKIILPIDKSVEIQKREEIQKEIGNPEPDLEEESESNIPSNKENENQTKENINMNQQELIKNSESLLEVNEKKLSLKLIDNISPNKSKEEEKALNEGRVLVEEIICEEENKINILNIENEKKKLSEINEKEISKLKYLTQENLESVFLILNIPSYEKEKFVQLLLENKVFLNKIIFTFGKKN